MGGDLILAADFGTSGVKVALVGSDMAVRHHAFASYPLSLPAPDMAEQAPSDWWNAFAAAIRTLTGEAGGLSGRIAAISFCAQFCAVVCIDGQANPIRPALIWLDKRAARQARALVGGFPTLFGYNVPRGLRWLQLANGAPSRNGMDPPCKMIWLRECEPDTWRRTHFLLDVKDWLVAKATGRVVTTADSANLTWMMDTRPGREGWSPSLARLVGVPDTMLPPIVDSASVAGTLRQAAAEEVGLDAGIPVMAGTNDVTAAALGSAAVADSELHMCMGHSAWVSCFHPRRVVSATASFATIDSGLSHRPLLIATQETAGAAIDWQARIARPGFAAASEPSMQDPFFIPWLAGERVPLDDERMRGSFTGLSLVHDSGHLRRAVIEGVAFNARWAYDKVRHKLRLPDTDAPLALVGGGALEPALVQALADVLRRPIRLGQNRLAGVIGAAAIGAAHAGWHPDVWAAARTIVNGGGVVIDPSRSGAALAAERYQRLEKLRPQLAKHYRKFGTGLP